MKHYITLFFLVLSVSLSAQLSKKHYFPPLAAASYNGDESATPKDGYIYLSTPSTDPVTVELFFGTSSVANETVVISNSSPEKVQLSNASAPYWEGPMNVQLNESTEDDFDNVLTNYGVRVIASSEIYANYRLNGSTSGAQGEMISSKGTAALGTKFWTGHLTNTDDYYDRCNLVSVMSLSDNNSITISNLNPNVNVKGLGNGAAHTITLDANESFIFASSPYDSPNPDIDGKAFIGALLTSDADIVVNVGSVNGNMINTAGTTQGGRDHAMDQIVPLDRVGTDYVLVKGRGINAHERPIVIATEANTNVYFNDNATPVSLQLAGEYYITSDASGNYYNGDDVMTIYSDKPVYVYQPVMANDQSMTQGMFFVPPINCSAPKVLDMVSDIDKIGNKDFIGRLNILVKDNATTEIVINGNSYDLDSNLPPSTDGPLTADFNANSNIDGYSAFKIDDLTGDIKVISTGDIYVGVFGYIGNAGIGAYFSGFSQVPEIIAATAPENCTPTLITATAGFDNYQWYFNGSPIAGETSETLNATEPGDYYVEAGVSGCTPDESEILTLIDSDFIDAGDDLLGCPNDGFQLDGSSSEPDADFEWSTAGDGTFNNIFLPDAIYTPGPNDIANGTVTLTLNGDNRGCLDSDEVVLTFEDDEAPVIVCPEDFTVNTDPGLCTASTDWSIVALSDNCSDIIFLSGTVFSNPSKSTLFDVGTTVVTIYATDESGNQGECSFNITVEDNEDPTANCPSDILIDTDTGLCEAEVDFTIPDPEDNCGATSVVDISSGSTFDLGTTTVTVTATDDAGNTDTCTFTVTVEDNEPPTMICQDATIELDSDGNASITIEDVLLPSSAEILNLISVSGDNGSFSSGVTDITAPVLTTQTLSFDWTYTTPDGAYWDTFGYLLNGTYVQLTNSFGGNNQSGSATVDVSAGDVFGFRSYTVDNIVGASSTTVSNFVPGFSGDYAPANWTLVLVNSDGSATFVPASSAVYAVDNCGGTVSISLSEDTFGCSDVGENTVTVTAIDVYGNTNTCDVTVTVEDNEAPEALCDDLELSLDENGAVTISAEDIDAGSTDNCGIASVELDADDQDWDCNEVGSHVVTLTVTDDSGNESECYGVVIIEDDTSPTIACNDLTVSLNSSGFLILDAEVIGAGTTDNCGELDLSYELDEDIILCEDAGSVVTVTLTVTDGSGNSSTCDAEITVEDNTEPTILECMHDLTFTTDPGLCTANSPFEDWTYIYTDNCLAEGITVTDDNIYDYNFPVGTTTVTLSFTDEAGNTATCSFDITVTDDEDPNALCEDITIQLDANGDASIVSTDIDGGSTDNCGIASLEISADDSDWGCADVGENIVVLTVTDIHGNVSTCEAIVTVEDNIAPEAICEDITIELDENGEATITASDIDGGSNDACGIASISIDEEDESWSCDEVGDNIVTLTVTDNNGNVSTCDATVTIEDNVAPEALCQDITVELDENGEATITASDIDGGSNDACGISSISIDEDDENWGCDDVGEHTVTLTVTDFNGNVSTCDATVTVEDNIAPEAICEDITIELDENGEATITAADIDGGSTDACGIASISIDEDDEDWNCDEVGENTVTLTVTDNNGNASTCDATVTVEDNLPPLLECADIVINLDPGLCGAVVDYDVESTDNCGVASEETVSGPESGDYLDYHDGPWTVTVDVTDVNGNVSTCSFSITMNEYANPTETLVCNDHVLVALDEDGCSIIGADMILEGGPYGCYDDYEVSVENGDLEVCCDEIGSELTVVITDPDTGNSCEGTIEVYDNLTPYCVSIEDYTIACEAELPSEDDITHPGYPVFGDNCSIDQIYLSVETVIDGDICSEPGMVVERIWYAIDGSGNVVADADVCTQTITIERTPLTFPTDQTYDCADYDVEDLTPDLTGEPTPASAAACLYNVVYTDQVLPLCGGLSKIIRTWTVLDWCTGEVILADENGTGHVQVIKLMDGEGPSINATDIVVGTDSDACGFTGLIPAPVITDNCTGVALVQMFIPGLPELEYVYDSDGNVAGGLVGEPGIDLGSATLIIVAVDACGNISEAEVTVSVEDQTEPLPICDEITQVAVSTNGIAEVFAESFDDGSYDNCCLDFFDVRRMDADEFGASVIFDCADIGTTVDVIFQAHDCFGNSNVCMVEVLVEDKIAPYLAVPAGTEISCDDYFENIAPQLDNGNANILDDLFGAATFGDNCAPILDYSYTYEVDQCGEGSIIRNWTVNDASENGPVSGSQTITIYHVSDWSISFPGDLDATCVDGALPDFGSPTVSDDACEMIAISFIDTQFDVVPDACYKIVREWSAINWCTYPDEAAVTATQVIKVTDDEAPIFDVEDFTVEITEADCDAAVTLPTPDVTDCSEDITIETSSDLPAGEAGPGTYTATYTVSDGCGNYSYDVITITVVDAKKPTPYLTDNLVTEIMQTGMTQSINVNDFDIGSFDNCSAVVLSYSPDVTDTERQFTCDDLGDNLLEVWVTDEAGNQDFATVTMTVQDNMNACGPGSLTVAGALHTAAEEGIEDATVDINGGLFSQLTDETGTFDFELEAGGDYSVVPSLDLDVSNGVSTFDIVLITQHILGMNPFTDPLKLIAADANNSNSVTTLDVVVIRMVILQITDSFPNNTSWRFVDKDHVFTNPTAPWDFPEVVNINNLNEALLDVDFTGIKIGDVNGSAQANFMSPAEARSGNSFELKTMDKQVSAGDEVRVPLQSDARISGMQFTLEHNGLEYMGMEAGLMSTEHIASHESALTFSWNEFELKDLSGEDLITLIFEAKGSIQLSESLVITSSMTRAEGYTDQGTESVDLVFENSKSITNVLYQNVPNPFEGQTVINFRLQKAGKAQILITDVDGKLIQQIDGSYPQGLNSVEVNRIKKSGVYYYQLNTEGYTATKKMIKI
jgi:uncharacterized protein YrzB (UPF0473 family)